MSAARVILLLGTERFLAREAIARIVADREDLEFTRFDGKEVAVAEVLDELRTPTLLGARRGVIVENAENLLTGKAPAQGERAEGTRADHQRPQNEPADDELAAQAGKALAALAAYAQKPVPETLLVLQARSLDKRFKAAKQLAQAAQTISCQPPDKEWKVAAWIAEHARERYGLSVARDAAEALRKRVGEDLGLLDQALLRLKEQIGPRATLRAGDVGESTGEHRSPVIYEASSALEERDLPALLRAIDGAFAEGIRMRQEIVTDERGIAPILLSNLHRGYGKLLRFHMARKTGASEREAAARAGVSPAAARYFLPRAQRHRLETLVARHRRFVEADLALKGVTSRLEPRFVLSQLAISLLR